MGLYRNRYRIESSRWLNWDYATAGAYFVTICTDGRRHFFGNIDRLSKEVVLSDIGRIVELEWLKTPDIRPDMNLLLGEFVVMPNHFHAILAIGENEYNGNRCDIEMPCMTSIQQPSSHLHNTKIEPGPQRKNLSSIIRGFKSAVTVQARVFDADFGWQARFHDRVIRSKQEYERIENYILKNPLKWGSDKFNTNAKP